MAVQLDRVQAAIAKIENGFQSLSVADRSVARANLKDLYDREERLLQRTDRADKGSRTVAEF